MRLYWVVAANLRDEILKSYDIHPTDLDDALEGAVLEMAAENRDGDANLEKTAAELARSIAREHPINGAMLIRTLRQGQAPLFEALFEEWSGAAMRSEEHTSELKSLMRTWNGVPSFKQ